MLLFLMKIIRKFYQYVLFIYIFIRGWLENISNGLLMVF